ncbi:MAG: TonB-dependent receptor [Bacteroidales bacterium]|nr:TonB-dependent receptor [Bacteroidales bacterium]MCF8390509.1 TonB-dependent receptor [Bacteroidales bacterium]
MSNRTLLLVMAAFMLSANLNSQSVTDTLSINELVVTGMRVDIARKNLPMNISVITEDQIDEIEESAVLSMVSRRIPSLFVNERGVTGYGRVGSSSAGNISVRGVGGNPNSQILVLVDGHPQYMGIFGHPLPNNYVSSDLQRVEVIRGPASILYGSNAMGGVLNFITKEQKEDGVSGSMRLGMGSFNTQKLMTNTGFKKGKLDFFISYNHDETDGHRENMDFRIDNSFAKLGYKFNENFKLTADFNIADMKGLDPGMVDSTEDVFVANMVRGKTSLSLMNKFDKMEGGAFAFMNFGDHNFSDGWVSKDENFGFSAFEGLKLIKANLITLGIDHKSYGGRGNIAFPPANANKWLEVTETGAYVIVQQNLFSNTISLTAGGRYESHSLFGSQFIPQTGISVNVIDDMSIKASYSEGYRSPTIMELYLFAPNSELLLEESKNIEAGISNTFLGGKLNTEITLYNVKGSNLIVMDYSNAPPPSRKNSGEFNHKGIELEANFLSEKNMSVDFSYSFLHMDNPRLSAPEHQLFTGVNYNIDKFFFALQANYIAGLYISTTSEVLNQNITENYFLLSASAKYQLSENTEFFVSGKNLLNRIYQIDYGYVMPGINFMTGIAVKF